MSPADNHHHDEFLRQFLAAEPSLRGFLRSLLLSHEEVSEVLQDTAVVLWRKHEPGRTDDAFCRWAFGVARMQALAYRRDRARDRLRFSEEVYALIERTATERTVEPDHRLEALDHCLGKLPPEQRALVAAAYSPDARIDELAAGMGRTAMAVYKSLHRIRIALADCVSKTLALESGGLSS